jgi:hypothetical protein
MTSFEEYLESLYGANKQKAINPTSPHKIRVTLSKRAKRSSQFAEISKTNTKIVDELADLAELLAKDGRGEDVKKLIAIIREILNNNQRLQEVVGDTLLDIPN